VNADSSFPSWNPDFLTASRTFINVVFPDLAEFKTPSPEFFRKSKTNSFKPLIFFKPFSDIFRKHTEAAPDQADGRRCINPWIPDKHSYHHQNKRRPDQKLSQLVCAIPSDHKPHKMLSKPIHTNVYHSSLFCLNYNNVSWESQCSGRKFHNLFRIAPQIYFITIITPFSNYWQQWTNFIRIKKCRRPHINMGFPA